VLATNYIADAFVIGIVAFTQSVSGARLLARKHNYKIDPNQVFSRLIDQYYNAPYIRHNKMLRISQKSLRTSKGQSESENRRMTIPWPKEKEQTDKQRSTKHYKTKDWQKRRPVKTGD